MEGLSSEIKRQIASLKSSNRNTPHQPQIPGNQRTNAFEVAEARSLVNARPSQEDYGHSPGQESGDPLLNIWNQLRDTAPEEVAKATESTKLSLRLPNSLLKAIDNFKGRTTSAKIKEGLSKSLRYREVIKSQAEGLISVLVQIEREMNFYQSNITKIEDLRGAEGAKIRAFCWEAYIFHRLICFNNDTHGEFLTLANFKTLDFAIRIAGKFGNSHTERGKQP